MHFMIKITKLNQYKICTLQKIILNNLAINPSQFCQRIDGSINSQSFGTEYLAINPSKFCQKIDDSQRFRGLVLNIWQ